MNSTSVYFTRIGLSKVQRNVGSHRSSEFRIEIREHSKKKFNIHIHDLIDQRRRDNV